ncbi:ribonuclease HII [Candidatus Peregrinibacteria bacterium]|nr:ribonuclease HII [Candidatus Peregrinibacteria bacterium]MBI3816224.1 ribonuclease HII [Candidatus Peregrinibacteria bacterium]
MVIEQQNNIAGLDEAGRGALAGPVVAGACILRRELFRRRYSAPRWSPFRKRPDPDCLIADSKQVTPEERATAFEWIIAHCAFGVGMVSAEEIDRRGILWATHRAMKMALAELQTKADVDHLLVDGRDAFFFDCPHTSIIRGDESQPCIAAASIVAKVTRDRWMIGQQQRHARFSFAEHKGYGTTAHIEELKAHGPCSLHRRSFLTRILDENDQAPITNDQSLFATIDQ